VSARNTVVEWTEVANAIRSLPYKRLATRYAHEAARELKSNDIRCVKGVVKSVQTAVEKSTIDHLHEASMLAMHAHRTTVQQSDYALVLKVHEAKVNDGDTTEMYRVIASRRDQSNQKKKKESSSSATSVAATDANGVAQVKKKKISGAAAISASKKKKVAAEQVLGGGGADGSASLNTDIVPPLPIAVA